MLYPTVTCCAALLWLALAGLATSVALAAPPGSWIVGKLALVSVAALFVAALWWAPLQRHLEQQIWQFLGFVSYPLYLVHENILVALTVKLARTVPVIPAGLLPVVGIAFVVVLAWLVARYAETAVRRLLPAPRAQTSPHLATTAARPLHA